MFVRGIDFARHNIIVGTDAESPVPTNTQAQQARGELVARVLAVSGAEATLQVGDQRMVVQAHVALNIGDKLFVRVYEGPGGSLRFGILASGPDGAGLPSVPDSHIDELLRSLGMPTDERTRQAARALLARDGTLDKPALQRLLADLRPFPEVTAREAGTAALLQKAGVPVNVHTMAAVIDRAQPQAAPRLIASLQALTQALEGAKAKLPPGSPKVARFNEALRLLAGLPLDEAATPVKVEAALREWVGRLVPQQAQARAAAVAGQQTNVQETLESALPAPATPLGQSIKEASAQLARLAGAELIPDSEADGPKQNAATRPSEAAPRAVPEAGKQASEPPSRVPPSQQLPSRLGITSVAPEPGKVDLAAVLERVGQEVGADHKAIRTLVKEAVAELRYTQLVNGPPPETAARSEHLVPLLVPHLSSEQPEGRLQVFHKARGRGEPIDPQNVRLVFVLDTDHLGTVQADLTIKDGVVDLVVGVPGNDDQDFLTDHIGELEKAIAGLGWETGRFGTRLAKAPPPKVRQEEGLTDIVRFDRRV